MPPHFLGNAGFGRRGSVCAGLGTWQEGPASFDIFVPWHWQILCGGVPEPGCAPAVTVSVTVSGSLAPFVFSRCVLLAGARGSSLRCSHLHLRPRCWCQAGAAPVHRGALLLGGTKPKLGSSGSTVPSSSRQASCRALPGVEAAVWAG